MNFILWVEVDIGFLFQMCLFLSWSIYQATVTLLYIMEGEKIKRERGVHKESNRKNKGKYLDKRGQIRLSCEDWG